MIKRTEEERFERNRSMAEIANDPLKAREYLLKASMLEDRI